MSSNRRAFCLSLIPYHRGLSFANHNLDPHLYMVQILRSSRKPKRPFFHVQFCLIICENISPQKSLLYKIRNCFHNSTVRCYLLLVSAIKGQHITKDPPTSPCLFMSLTMLFLLEVSVGWVPLSRTPSILFCRRCYCLYRCWSPCAGRSNTEDFGEFLSVFWFIIHLTILSDNRSRLTYRKPS